MFIINNFALTIKILTLSLSKSSARQLQSIFTQNSNLQKFKITDFCKFYSFLLPTLMLGYI